MLENTPREHFINTVK